MRVRAKRWRRDVEATEEASKVQAIADNETDARTLGRLIEAIETPNELTRCLRSWTCCEEEGFQFRLSGVNCCVRW